MLKPMLKSFLLATLLLAGPVALAADRSRAEVAEAIVVKSGVAAQLGDFAPSLRAGITTNPELASKMSEQQLGTLLGAFDSAYAPARLKADIAAELVKALKPAQANEALVWLESPVGAKITALEDEATALAQDPNGMAEAQKLLERLPPRRGERYIALMKATGADEAGARIALNSSLGMAYGAAATLGKSAPDLAAMRKELEAQKPQMVEALGNVYLTMFASIYQNLPEAELDQYLAFAESPTGRAYHQALIGALDVALTGAAKEVGRQIGESERAARGKTGA